MKKHHAFSLLAISSLFLTGLALAEQPAAPEKSVTFKIINNTKHTIDLDTDGGVKGACKQEKDFTVCTADPEGKLSIGGHLAVDRSFKKPAGIYGAILSATNPADESGRNFAIQNIESSPVRATISKEKWEADKEEVTITVTEAKNKTQAPEPEPAKD